MPKIVWILVVDNIAAAKVDDKNILIQLIIQEFSDHSHNIIIDEKASTKLQILQKKKIKTYIYIIVI